MIAYFPELYPDELLYSAVARYHKQSGHMFFRNTTDEVYANPKELPNVLFFDTFSPELINLLTSEKSLQQVISEHTMVNYYVRYLPYIRKQKALECIQALDISGLKKIIRWSRKGESIYIRYCPECAMDNREKYGETFFERKHQMFWISNVCPVHGCLLRNSSISIDKDLYSFTTAEEVIPIDEETEYPAEELPLQLAQYSYDIFKAKVDYKSNVPVGKFLRNNVPKDYTSPRGETVWMNRLYQAYLKSYKNVNLRGYDQQRHLVEVFDDREHNPMIIAFLGFFLGIPASKMVNPRMPEMTIFEEYDKRVQELHRQGLTYKEIAVIVGGSEGVVKAVGRGKFQKPPKSRSKTNKVSRISNRKIDYKQLDDEWFPMVKKAVSIIRGDTGAQPRQVNVGSVARYLGISFFRLRLCPHCRDFIRENSEPIEVYWCRCLQYSLKYIREHHIPLLKTNLFIYAHGINNEKYRRCSGRLEEVLSKEEAEMIRSICGK